MLSRRELAIGAGCLAASAGAYKFTPRNRVSLLGSSKLEQLVPKAFAGWRLLPSDAVLVPEGDDSLAAKLYSQTLALVYMSADDDPIMLLIAYGDTQSDQLQLHRPEVCYPAFGFNVVMNEPAKVDIAPSIALSGRNLIARSNIREEYVTYWTRIGEFLPENGNAQRWAKLRTAFAGVIPDGVLVRISTIGPKPANAFALNQRFARDMLMALVPDGRRALIGTDAAQRLGSMSSSREVKPADAR